MAHTERIVVLVDMDCFYCQVEEKLDPKLEGKPIAVVQYNAWRGGGIIAVNYVARDKGVTRHMRGDEAKEKCPEIELVRVPQVRGKADLTKYREAGKRVAEVLQTFTPLLERASVDEAYLDITEQVNKRIETLNSLSIDLMKNTYVVGRSTADFLDNVWQNRKYCESDFKLSVGGLLTEEIRAKVFEITGYKCSAGIAHNKILAKLACGIHKPNKQTILPQDSISELYATLPIRKIKSLGGKFGNLVSEKLGISNMGELAQFSEKELAAQFDEKSANWLYKIAKGIDNEPVTTKLISKSIGCCKKFPGKTALLNEQAVLHWMSELALEIAERLQKDIEENHRRARNIVVSYSQDVNGKEVSSTRTVALNAYDQNKICTTGMEVIKKNCLKADGSCCIKFLGISVGHFEEIKKVREITSFFTRNNISKNPQNCDDKKCQLESNSLTNIKAESTSIKITEKQNKSEINKNVSIFDADTDEEDIDKSSLVYYNDNNSSKQSNTTNSYKDSITQEINVEVNDKSVPTKQKHSFFAQYFDNISKQSEIPRNFDTSAAMKSDEVEEIDDDQIMEDPKIDNNETDQNVSEMNTDLDNICSLCNKSIAIDNMQSHMDYHYAIQLVKDEAHLYQNQPSHSKELKTESAKSRTNKKHAQKQNNLKPISSFLHKETENVNVENSELCTECHKRIRVDDFSDHLDYHAAKKLHLELNFNANTSKKVSHSKNTVKKTGKKIKPSQSHNIASYFAEKS